MPTGSSPIQITDNRLDRRGVQDYFHHRRCMLEIILLLTIAALAAARKPTRRRRFTLRKVKISPNLSLSTLASVTVLTTSLIGTSDTAYRLMSLDTTWSLQGFTAGEGPIIVGVAFGDYTVTEIKENIEAAASINLGNKIAQEQANRLIRQIASFASTEEANNALKVRTKLNWAVPIGSAVSLFAYNDGAATLTTGSRVSVAGNMWVKDNV